MFIIFKACGVILFADFVTGLVHWLEDSFWTPETPILGKWIVMPNLAHHKNGQAFLQKSWWESSWDLLLIGVLTLIIGFLLHRLTWELGLFAFIIANANQIHKWAHTSVRTRPKIISFLQKIYFLQSAMHHGQHHRKPNNTHFCTVTNLLNPILDKIQFWRGLERIIACYTN